MQRECVRRKISNRCGGGEGVYENWSILRQGGGSIRQVGYSSMEDRARECKSSFGRGRVGKSQLVFTPAQRRKEGISSGRCYLSKKERNPGSNMVWRAGGYHKTLLEEQKPMSGGGGIDRGKGKNRKGSTIFNAVELAASSIPKGMGTLCRGEYGSLTLESGRKDRIGHRRA